MKNRNTLACFAMATLGLMLCAESSQAAEKKISGTISTTLTLTENSELVGDVTCTVSGGPCIASGAADITLRLNGFTITGTIPGCTPATSLNDGIDVLTNDVTILGPGLIQKFGGFGIFLFAESGAEVHGITVTDSCFSGIILAGATDSTIEGNTSVRNAMGSEGAPCGGTWIASSSHNRVRLNTYYGNGLATSKDSPASPNSNNFGVGLVGGSNNNVIEENQIGGNLNGVYIDASGDAGNTIRSNRVFGNPPGQVSTEFGALIGADIQDMSTPGANTFEDNRCLTYAGAMVPAPCPRIRQDEDAEAQNPGSVWPVTAFAQRADVGLMDFEVGITLEGAAALLIVGLAVPKRRSRIRSRKN